VFGSSAGLAEHGHALAEHVLKQGDRLVLAARNVTSMLALAASYPAPLVVGLEVSDLEQRIAGLQRLKPDLARSTS
jgi:NADP-dependent 3-hydroxy acid dehydrogenase YdfG